MVISHRFLYVYQAGYSDKPGHGDFAQAWYRDLGRSDCDLRHQSLTALATPGLTIKHPQSFKMTNMCNLLCFLHPTIDIHPIKYRHQMDDSV